jgi:hypothetical protein
MKMRASDYLGIAVLGLMIFFCNGKLLFQLQLLPIPLPSQPQVRTLVYTGVGVVPWLSASMLLAGLFAIAETVLSERMLRIFEFQHVDFSFPDSFQGKLKVREYRIYILIRVIQGIMAIIIFATSIGPFLIEVGASSLESLSVDPNVALPIRFLVGLAYFFFAPIVSVLAVALIRTAVHTMKSIQEAFRC